VFDTTRSRLPGFSVPRVPTAESSKGSVWGPIRLARRKGAVVTLTDEQKRQAKELGLTQDEARFSLATRIPLTRYAEIKAQIAEEGEARQAQEVAGNEFVVERARHFAPYGRGERPWPKETDEGSSEDGG
jgi:hypothetical protein